MAIEFEKTDKFGVRITFDSVRSFNVASPETVNVSADSASSVINLTQTFASRGSSYQIKDLPVLEIVGRPSDDVLEVAEWLAFTYFNKVMEGIDIEDLITSETNPLTVFVPDGNGGLTSTGFGIFTTFNWGPDNENIRGYFEYDNATDSVKLFRKIGENFVEFGALGSSIVSDNFVANVIGSGLLFENPDNGDRKNLITSQFDRSVLLGNDLGMSIFTNSTLDTYAAGQFFLRFNGNTLASQTPTATSVTAFGKNVYKYEFDFDAPLSYSLTHVYVTTDISTPGGKLMIAAYNRNNNGDEDQPLSSNVPISDFFSDTPLGESISTGSNEYYIKLTEDFNVIEGQEMTVKFWSTTPLVFVGGDVFVPSLGVNQLHPKYDFTLTQMNFVKDVLNPNGFIDYNDTSSSGGIPIPANTWVDLPNDGLGAFTNKNFPPSGVTELMDTSTGYIDPTELALGDTILVRNDFIVTPSGNRALLSFRYELGSGLGTYSLEKIINRLDSGAGIPYRESLSPDLIYMGDANTRDNPIKIQIKLSKSGTLVNNGTVIQLVKR